MNYGWILRGILFASIQNGSYGRSLNMAYRPSDKRPPGVAAASFESAGLRFRSRAFAGSGTGRPGATGDEPSMS